jgi:hypothetical protein
MRRLYLTLAASAAILSTGMLPQSANAMTPGAGGLRTAIQETAVIDQVRTVCTHWWNGHGHHHARCFWAPGHYHHWHHHHHHHHRHHHRH